MPKRKKIAEKFAEPLDTFSEKRVRGRPPLVDPSHLVGRAENYRRNFDRVWDRLWPRLSQATTEQEVTDAFSECAAPYAQDFVPGLASLIVQVLRGRKFPKRRQPQVNFMADSLAGLGQVSPRTSRDICQKHRAREKRAHRILRYEVYVECSCGYKGRSWNLACRKCGALLESRFSPLRTLI